MLLKRLFLLVGLVTVLAVPAVAQGPAGTGRTTTVTLTLDEAVNRALAQGEEMQTARAQYRDAQGQVREALAGALPQVNGSLTYSRQFASIYQSLGSGTGSDTGITSLFKNSPFGAPNSWNASVTASQLLFSAGKVGAGLKAAKAFRAGTDAQQRETAADVAFRVKRAYLQAQYAERVLEVATAGLEEARKELRQVQLFQRAGTRAEYDLLRAQVDAANQEPVVVQAQGNLDLAILELKRLVNVPVDQDVTLATPLTAPDGTIPAVADETLTTEIERPALTAAEANVQVRRQILRGTKADRWPSLSVQSTFSEQAFPQQVLPFDARFRRNWDAQVKVSVPLFNGFRTEAQVARAQAALDQAIAQRNTVQEQVALDVAQARAELKRTGSLLAARRETVRQAQRAMHLASVRYANGLSTQLEVSDARLLSQRAGMNQAQSTLDYLVALAQLERALGRPLPLERKPLEQAAGTNTEADARIGMTNIPLGSQR
ncbi:MAG: TolC family protein [Gemmatimonadetes bacterium]|nr:TolC family protein [Gemmatimonadota bacterium]